MTRHEPYQRLTPAAVEKKPYEKKLKELSKRIAQVQNSIIANNVRVIVVFEGMDAAGKGGTIRRLSAPFDPRILKVWPIAAPKPEYRGLHHLRRFWDRLPELKQCVIFDRSWYGRVLVERVEGFASDEEWQRGYQELVDFETLLANDGVVFFKVFLAVSEDEQFKRLVARLERPEKHWKITAEDFRNREKADAYSLAVNDMLEKTSHAQAPWLVVESDDKRAARLAVLDAFVTRMEAELPSPPPSMLSEEVRLYAREKLGIEVQ